MTTTKQIDQLWDQFADFIQQVYENNRNSRNQEEADTASVLRSYVPGISWSNSLAKLLGRAEVEERRHRRGTSDPHRGFSITTAAKLLLMQSAADGSRGTAPPPSTDFLMYRQERVEAEVLGYLLRRELGIDLWREEVCTFDYCKLMNPGAL